MTRLDDEHGRPRALAKIARDATQQKENEEALLYARDQLEQRVLERTADLIATNKELRDAMAERERLERELLDISERERNRIGHELHDVLCQELTATALFLKSTSSKIKDAQAARSLNEAADIVNRNVAIARDLARGLQPDVVGTGGLIDALRALCKQVNEHPTIRCRLKVPKIVRISDEVLALTVYRVAQEAVRNAVVHADPTEIIICVEREADLVRLVVEDDGKGFKPRKGGKGLGLSIMKYRASVLGGTLRIDLRPERGTRITCEVPTQAARRAKQKK
jgi:signal transduction histidine kinase